MSPGYPILALCKQDENAISFIERYRKSDARSIIARKWEGNSEFRHMSTIEGQGRCRLRYAE